MKERNQFHHFSKEDQKFIFDLCAKNTYDDAVEILRRPRAQGGLDIITSPSALCRFYTTHHPEPTRILLAQYASAAHVRHEIEGNAFLGAIRAAAECRILEALKNGVALSNLDKEIRSLKAIHKLFLDDARWRQENPKQAKAAYNSLVDRCSDVPSADFLRADVPNDPGAEGLVEADYFDVDEFDLDVCLAALTKKQARDAHDREVTARQAAAASAAAVPPPVAAAQPAQSSAPAPVRPMRSAPGGTVPNGGVRAKSPVIPPIPPNSTSAVARPPLARKSPPVPVPALDEQEWRSALAQATAAPVDQRVTAKYASPGSALDRAVQSFVPAIGALIDPLRRSDQGLAPSPSIHPMPPDLVAWLARPSLPLAA